MDSGNGMEQRDFSLRFEITAGAASRPSALSGTTSTVIATSALANALSGTAITTNLLNDAPSIFCHLDFVPLSSRLCPSVSSTLSLCLIDLVPLSHRPAPAVISNRRERSHAAIIRLKKGILGIMRFLAPLRNDKGEKRNDKGEKRNDRGEKRNDRGEKRNDRLKKSQ